MSGTVESFDIKVKKQPGRKILYSTNRDGAVLVSK